MLRLFLRVNGVTYSGMAEPFQVIIRVLSAFGAAAGVLVVVLAGLDGLEAFVEGTLAQLCWRAAGRGGRRDGRPGGRVGAVKGGGAELQGPAGGGGRAADWMMFRRDARVSSDTLVVSVATFSTSAGLLLYLVGGDGGALAAFSSFLMRWRRSLIMSAIVPSSSGPPASLMSESCKTSRSLRQGGGWPL